MLDNTTLRAWCKENRLRPRFYYQDPEPPKVIILGELHYDAKHKKNAEELISLVKPEFILYECLGAQIYNPKTKKTIIHPDVPRSPFHDCYEYSSKDWTEVHMMGLADRFQITAIGINPSFGEFMDFDEALIENDPNMPLDAIVAKERIFQEKRMASRIAEYNAKTEKQLIAVMGRYHRRPASAIHQALQQTGIMYVCIYQPRSENTMINPGQATCSQAITVKVKSKPL